MWTKGSRSRRLRPAKARRTGKPSPSNPLGAVVTEVTARSAEWFRSRAGTFGSFERSSGVTAGTDASNRCAPATWFEAVSQGYSWRLRRCHRFREHRGSPIPGGRLTMGETPRLQAASDLPGEGAAVLLEGTGGAVPADGGHANDDLRPFLDRLPGPADGSEVGGSEAGLDGIELDVWQCLGVLDREHRDGGLARAVDDGGIVELAPVG